MNRILSFAMFFTIMLSIFFLMHFVVYRVLTNNIDFFSKYKGWVKLILFISGLTFPVSMTLSRTLHIHFLNYFAYIWLGIISISFFTLLITWLVVKILPRFNSSITIGALIITGILVIYSLVNGLMLPRINRVEIPIKNLPARLDGFSIVQISDLHLEPFKSKHVIEHVVKTVESIQPDLVVITGDLLEGDNIWTDAHFMENLKKIKPRHGVLAVTGNHEFYAGMNKFMKLTTRAGIKLLRNEMIVIDDILQVVGVDDKEAVRFTGEKPDIEKILANSDPQKPTILLNHRPGGFDEAVKAGVDLQLSGHTHAGQIPPMDLLVYLYYKYPAGLYTVGDAHIYTSMGSGYWGPPMRLFNHSELVHLVLKKAD